MEEVDVLPEFVFELEVFEFESSEVFEFEFELLSFELTLRL